MSSLEGPAHGSDQSTASRGLPEAPPLTPERAQQELGKLAEIVTTNETLNFLEPRLRRCQESGSADLPTLLSFYRLISLSLSEELGNQKDALAASQNALVQAKQSTAQAAMQAALDEASIMVQAATRGEASPALPAPTSGAVMSEEGQAKLEQAEKQIERLMQDMQNMRNRAKIDVEVRVFKELEKFSHSLLPALDAFYQAMPSLKTTSDINSIVTGVTMIHDQLQESLEKAGLIRLKVVGQPFDPRFHEAIGEVPTTDVADDHIFDELQPGYLLGERVVRAAMVRIARNDGPPPAPAPAPSMAAASQPASASPHPERPSLETSSAAPSAPSAPTAPLAANPAPATPDTASPNSAPSVGTAEAAAPTPHVPATSSQTVNSAPPVAPAPTVGQPTAVQLPNPNVPTAASPSGVSSPVPGVPPQPPSVTPTVTVHEETSSRDPNP